MDGLSTLAKLRTGLKLIMVTGIKKTKGWWIILSLMSSFCSDDEKVIEVAMKLEAFAYLWLKG